LPCLLNNSIAGASRLEGDAPHKTQEDDEGEIPGMARTKITTRQKTRIIFQHLQVWGMNIHNLNTTSTSRKDEVRKKMKKDPPDIIMICESNGTLNISGYTTVILQHKTTAKE